MENNLNTFRTISHFLKLIVIPEVENRINKGVINNVNLPVQINQFKLVWDNLNNKIITELNNEVEIIVDVKGKREIKAGEALMVKDIYPDECYIKNPIIDGRTCSFYICKSLYLGFITYFNFLPNAPDFEESKLGNLNMKYNIIDFINFEYFKNNVNPFEKLKILSDNNWPPAPGFYPQIILEYHNNPEIVNNGQIIDMVSEVYDYNFWNNHFDFWSSCNFFPNRVHYLKKAIDSFFNNDYISTIFTIVPQFEGIIKNYLLNQGLITDWEEKGFKSCVDELENLIFSRKIMMFPKEIFKIICEYLKDGSFWAYTGTITNPNIQINRHGILHGLFTGFECKEIAMKYLLLLDSLAFILLHDKMVTFNL